MLIFILKHVLIPPFLSIFHSYAINLNAAGSTMYERIHKANFCFCYTIFYSYILAVLEAI